MRLLDRTRGFKHRQAAERKLCILLGDEDTNPGTLGMVIANRDGTYSAAVLLTDKTMELARPLAEAGIYVMGPVS